MYKDEKSGFTEINKKFKELTGETGVKATPERERFKSLNTVKDQTKRDGMIKSMQLLMKQGPDKFRLFHKRLKESIAYQQEDKYKSNFVSRVKRVNLAKEPSKKVTMSEPKVKKKGFLGGLFGKKKDIAEQRRARAEQRNIEARHETLKDEEEGPDKATNNAMSAFSQIANKRKSVNTEKMVVNTVDTRRGTPQELQTNTQKTPEEPTQKIDQAALNNEMQMAEENPDIKTKKEEGYTEIETVGEDNQKTRTALVVANRAEGIQSWENANRDKEFRFGDKGGKDTVRFAIEDQNGNKKEVDNLPDLYAWEECMGKCIADNVSAEEMMNIN